MTLLFDDLPSDGGDRHQFAIAMGPREGLKQLQRPFDVSSAKEECRKDTCKSAGLHRSLPSLPDHVSHERTCQFADAAWLHALPAGFSLPANSAADLALNADGRSLSLHCRPASVSVRLNCFNQSRKVGSDAGNPSQISAIFSKFGKGQGRAYRD